MATGIRAEIGELRSVRGFWMSVLQERVSEIRLNPISEILARSAIRIAECIADIDRQIMKLKKDKTEEPTR